MKPAQFRQLLAKARLTQLEAARLIGVSDRTMRRYVAGRGSVPKIVVLAVLRVIEKGDRV